MPNGSNDLERELLELARLQREANQRQTLPARELPDLDPGMLLSAAALDEVQAAATAAGQPIGVLMTTGNHEDMVAFETEPPTWETDLDVPRVGSAVYHEALEPAQVAAIHSQGPNANRDVYPESLYRQEVMAEFSRPNPVFTDEDLEAVFMSNIEAREAMGAGVTPMVPDISIPIVSTPIRTTRDRLNVGWDPAVRIPRIAQHHDMAHRDGPNVVSTRMPDGSWRSRPLPRPHQAPPQRHQGVSMGTTVARAPEPAQTETAPAGPRANRYAVLSGSDPFD